MILLKPYCSVLDILKIDLIHVSTKVELGHLSVDWLNFSSDMWRLAKYSFTKFLLRGSNLGSRALLQDKVERRTTLS